MNLRWTSTAAAFVAILATFACNTTTKTETATTKTEPATAPAPVNPDSEIFANFKEPPHPSPWKIRLEIDNSLNVVDDQNTCSLFSRERCFISKAAWVANGKQVPPIRWYMKDHDHKQEFAADEMPCKSRIIQRGKDDDKGGDMTPSKWCTIVVPYECVNGDIPGPGGKMFCTHKYKIYANNTMKDPDILIEEGVMGPTPDNDANKAKAKN
ncbi:MAG: hypothetical protein ABI995_00640 [Acidobacteriota bacterium]